MHLSRANELLTPFKSAVRIIMLEVLIMNEGVHKLLDAKARERLLSEAQQLLEGEPAVLAAWLYGSVARGQAARDIDLALLIASGHDAWSVAQRVAVRLESALGHLLPLDVRPVDNGSAPAFRFAIVRDGLLLYERDNDARRLFWMDAVREWLDVAPMISRLSQAFIERNARVT